MLEHLSVAANLFDRIEDEVGSLSYISVKVFFWER